MFKKKRSSKNLSVQSVVSKEASANSVLASKRNTNTECLLIADVTLACAPPHLRALLRQFDIAKLTQTDLLFFIAYLIALECGFMPQKLEPKFTYTAITSTSSFHSKNVLKFSQLMPVYSYDFKRMSYSMHLRSNVDTTPENPSDLDSLLTGIVSGDLLILTLSACDADKSGFCVCLSVPRYVPISVAKGKPLSHYFRKMDELSLELRENLFVPMRNRQMDLINAHMFPALMGLPFELYDEVFKLLDNENLKTLCNVNVPLQEYVQNNKRFKALNKE